MTYHTLRSRGYLKRGNIIICDYYRSNFDEKFYSWDAATNEMFNKAFIVLDDVSYSDVQFIKVRTDKFELNLHYNTKFYLV